MSYDFMMMKPKGAIPSIEALSEDTVVAQEPEPIVQALSSLLPATSWQRESDGGWFGRYDGDDTWYEFRINGAPDLVWSINTSHRTHTRSLIQPICNALGVVAFDGQAMVLVKPEG